MSAISFPDISLLPGVHPLVFEKKSGLPIESKDPLAVELLGVLTSRQPHIDLTLEGRVNNPTDVIGLRGRVYNYNLTSNDEWSCISFIDVTTYHELLTAWQTDFDIMRTAHTNLVEFIQIKDSIPA